MAAPQLVTLLFDALVEAHVAKPAMLSRDLARFLEHKIVVIDPDELHVIDIKPDGSWTMAHPITCRPQLFGCVFTTLAMAGFEAPSPGRFTVVITEDEDKPAIKVVT